MKRKDCVLGPLCRRTHVKYCVFLRHRVLRGYPALRALSRKQLVLSAYVRNQIISPLALVSYPATISCKQTTPVRPCLELWEMLMSSILNIQYIPSTFENYEQLMNGETVDFEKLGDSVERVASLVKAKNLTAEASP